MNCGHLKLLVHLELLMHLELLVFLSDFKIDRSGMQYFVATEGAPQVPTCPRGNVGKKRRSSSPPAERRLSASSKSHSRTRSNAEGECQIERPSPRRKSVTSKRSDRSASRESDELKSYFRQLQYLLVTSFDRNRNFDDQDDLRQELAEKMKAPAPFMTVCGTDVEMQEALNPSHPIQLHKLRDFVPLHVKGGPPEASAFYGRLEDTDAYTKISRAPNCIILQIENGEYADRRRKKNVLLLQTSSGIVPDLHLDISKFRNVASTDIAAMALQILPYMDHENSACLSYCSGVLRDSSGHHPNSYQIDDYLTYAREHASTVIGGFGKAISPSGSENCVNFTVYNIDRDDYETPLEDRREGFTIFITTTQGLKTLHAMPFWNVSPLHVMLLLKGKVRHSLARLFNGEAKIANTRRTRLQP